MANTADSFAIQTAQLCRTYKIRGARTEEPTERVALRDVDLSVRPGELFGLLGPNGAGKTTLIKILVTLLAPSAGRAWVAGHDVSAEPQRIRPKINMVSGGESVGYGLLTVRENLWMFAQFYGLSSKVANQRIKALLDMVGMGDRLNSKSSDLSTGLRQKMNIVRGFITDPQVLFLDEPTVGLDVSASRQVRSFIRQWIEDRPGRTILLTTHQMAEADELCDRVAIIDRGQLLACDTPANLKRRLRRDAIFHVEVSPLNGGTAGLAELPGVRSLTHTAREGLSELDFILDDDDALGAVIGALRDLDAHLLHLQKREPTLEDVFVDLVGRGLSEDT